MKTKYICETCGKEYDSVIEAGICKTLHEDTIEYNYEKAIYIIYSIVIVLFTLALILDTIKTNTSFCEALSIWGFTLLLTSINCYNLLIIYYLKKRAKDNSHQLDNEQIKWRKERIEEHGF